MLGAAAWEILNSLRCYINQATHDSFNIYLLKWNSLLLQAHNTIPLSAFKVSLKALQKKQADFSLNIHCAAHSILKLTSTPREGSERLQNIALLRGLSLSNDDLCSRRFKLVLTFKGSFIERKKWLVNLSFYFRGRLKKICIIN